ncbi:MAG: hypothetical protein IAF00_12410 [Phycisphaerales bacterium]|nr:hypothetical protein [Phycisphaerales bacterium]
MRERIVAVLGVVSLLTTVGCTSMSVDKHKGNEAEKAQVAQQESAPTPAPVIAESETVTTTATVRAIDLKNRLVTLKPKSGQPFTIHAGDEVRNLSQVRVGDQVVMKYTEAMAVRINRNTKGGIPSRKETISGERAALGQKPANTIDIVANVLAIDRQGRRITFQGPENTVTVKAPADVDISRLDVGDQVLLTYVEELAISVEPAAAKKSSKKKK